MNGSFHIQPLDHRDAAVARAIQSVLAPASAQEAERLGPAVRPPPPCRVADIQGSGDFYLGAHEAADLRGVLSIGPDDEPGQLCIRRLVVHPQAQRRGVGRMLVGEALARGPGLVFAVSVGALNAPALALYQGLGFVPYREGRLGPQDLAMLKLRRVPAQLGV